MVNPSGNGNGGYSTCAPPDWWDDGIDNRPDWYPRESPTKGFHQYPCWTLDPTNWMNGRSYKGLPNVTPGWPGWIHGVNWGPQPDPSNPYAKGQREITVAFPISALQIIHESGPKF